MGGLPWTRTTVTEAEAWRPFDDVTINWKAYVSGGSVLAGTEMVDLLFRTNICPERSTQEICKLVTQVHKKLGEVLKSGSVLVEPSNDRLSPTERV